MGSVHRSVWDSFVPDFNHSVIQQPQKSSLLFSTRVTSCTCFTSLPGSRAKPLALDPVKLPYMENQMEKKMENEMETREQRGIIRVYWCWIGVIWE